MTITALVGAGAGVTLVPALSLGGSWMTDSGVIIRREKSRKACRSVRLVFRSTFPRRELIEKLADIVCAIAPDTVSPAPR
jgi:LysR family hydrogen peroxide-inducible transcriptional activator